MEIIENRKKMTLKDKCSKRLQRKIEKLIKEYEDGKFKSRKQALAVAYKMTIDDYPECEKYYRRD